MLILTRKCGESIFIGEDIKVHVIEVRGKQVRLGCEAPKKHPIHRSEVRARIAAEREAQLEQARSA